MDIKIPLLRVQREFLQATEDFVVIVSSRSCGKTWIAVLDALMEVMRGNNILYMCQNDGAWYKGGWIHLLAFLRKFNLESAWSWNGTYKTGTLFGSKFFVGTYENVDGARGATECSTLYLDEFMLSRPNIMAALSPCLRGLDRFGNPCNPRIRGVSTPNMMSLWQLMVLEPDKYGIRVLRSKMTENVFITDKQREVMAKSIFDEKLRRQEIDGEIIVGESATSLITLADFPKYAPTFSDTNVYAGLDMAHTGMRDGHAFAAIRGNELLAFHEFGMSSSEDVAHWIRRFNQVHKIANLNMDLAWSESVYDQLKYEIPCRQVSFAEAAPTPEESMQYANIRAYGYFHLARMHKNGLCVEAQPSEFIDSGIVAEYKREIVNTHFLNDRRYRLILEPKEDIKARIGRSPDPADALMLASLQRSLNDDPIIKNNNAGMTEAQIEAIMGE